MLGEKVGSVQMALRALYGQVNDEALAVLKLADSELSDIKQLGEDLEGHMNVIELEPGMKVEEVRQ